MKNHWLNTYEVCPESTITEAVFTETKMNNASNVDFL